MHRHDFWNQKSQIQRPQPHTLIQLCPELTVRNNSIRLNWKQRLHSSSSKRHFLLSGKETWSLKHGTVSATCCTYDHRQTTVQTATWTMGVPPGLSCQLLWGQGKTHNTCQLWGITISIIIIIRKWPAPNTIPVIQESWSGSKSTHITKQVGGDLSS